MIFLFYPLTALFFIVKNKNKRLLQVNYEEENENKREIRASEDF